MRASRAANSAPLEISGHKSSLSPSGDVLSWPDRCGVCCPGLPIVTIGASDAATGRSSMRFDFFGRTSIGFARARARCCGNGASPSICSMRSSPHAELCGCLQPAPDPSPSTKRRRFSTNAATCWSWGESSCNLHGRRSIGPRRRLLAGIGTSDDRLSPATPSADHSGLDPGHNVVPVVAGAIYSK